MSGVPAGLFVQATPFERTVTLADGTEHVLFFRALPAIDFDLLAMQSASQDPEVSKRASARMVVQSLCDKDGKRVLTEEDGDRLTRSVLVQMVEHVMDVSGFKRTAKKAAAEKKP